ncbi:MAG: hypothetical protein U0M42_08175 [Acutalibacteraceae bacterium]|nr:hypothetical protein [Acutalibacteraceae bacterium]
MNSILISVFEIVMVCFTIWCLFHEKALVEFEKRIARNIRRRRFKVIKGSKGVKKYYA